MRLLFVPKHNSCELQDVEVECMKHHENPAWEVMSAMTTQRNSVETSEGENPVGRAFGMLVEEEKRATSQPNISCEISVGQGKGNRRSAPMA